MPIVPRFAGIPTFMRCPTPRTRHAVDIALVGVPWDGGTTNRAGARHGPREIRNQSSLMRRVHHVTRHRALRARRVADLGDRPVNPIDLDGALKRRSSSSSRRSTRPAPRRSPPAATISSPCRSSAPSPASGRSA